MSEAAAEYRAEPSQEQFQLATDIHQICLLKIVEIYRQEDHSWGYGAACVDRIITELEKEIIQEVMEWRERTPRWARSIPKGTDIYPVEQMMAILNSEPGREEPAPQEPEPEPAPLPPEDPEDIEDEEEGELPPAAPPIAPPKAPGPCKAERKAPKEGGKATATASIVLRSRIQALLDEGCSMATLADKAKLSEMTVRNILGGSNPRAVTYDKLADALDRLGA